MWGGGGEEEAAPGSVPPGTPAGHQPSTMGKLSPGEAQVLPALGAAPPLPAGRPKLYSRVPAGNGSNSGSCCWELMGAEEAWWEGRLWDSGVVPQTSSHENGREIWETGGAQQGWDMGGGDPQSEPHFQP